MLFRHLVKTMTPTRPRIREDTELNWTSPSSINQLQSQHIFKKRRKGGEEETGQKKEKSLVFISFVWRY